MWIDTHAHLYDYSNEQLAELLSVAEKSGVGAVVSTATSPETAPVTIAQAQYFPAVWSAVGVSPFDVEHVPSSWADALSSLCVSDKVLAIGEIGIDGTSPAYPSIALQKSLFEQQLEVAKSAGLPAVLHSRGLEEEAVAICSRQGVTDAVFHCFTGSRHALEQVVTHGYYVSLSGIITFKNCALRNYIKTIPSERLLIETDCPYLAPVPHRGKKNHPAWVRHVGEEVARLRKVPVKELELQVEKNFRTLFKKFHR